MGADWAPSHCPVADPRVCFVPGHVEPGTGVSSFSMSEGSFQNPRRALAAPSSAVRPGVAPRPPAPAAAWPGLGACAAVAVSPPQTDRRPRPQGPVLFFLSAHGSSPGLTCSNVSLRRGLSRAEAASLHLSLPLSRCLLRDLSPPSITVFSDVFVVYLFHWNINS